MLFDNNLSLFWSSHPKKSCWCPRSFAKNTVAMPLANTSMADSNQLHRICPTCEIIHAVCIQHLVQPVRHGGPFHRSLQRHHLARVAMRCWWHSLLPTNCVWLKCGTKKITSYESIHTLIFVTALGTNDTPVIFTLQPGLTGTFAGR